MKPIEVWPFHEAPAELRDALFDNGGDEDWLAIVPPEVLDNDPWPTWLDHLGVCCVNRYAVADDGTLLCWESQIDGTIDAAWKWLHDRPKFPQYAGCEIRVGCHA